LSETTDDQTEDSPAISEWAVGLAYEQALRAADRDAAVLDQLRTRTAVLVTASGVVTSLMGQTALKAPHPLGLVIASLVAFAAGLAASLGVFWPAGDQGRLGPPDLSPRGWRNRWRRRGRERRWKVTITRRDFERRSNEHEVALKRSLADLLYRAHRLNQFTIGRRTDLFGVAALLLGAQVLLWALVLLF